MRSFVKIKSSQNGEITQSFSDECEITLSFSDECHRRKFYGANMSFNAIRIRENRIIAKNSEFTVYRPRSEKTSLRGLRLNYFQTSLSSYRD